MRTAIKPRSDISEITKRVAEKLGYSQEEVKKEINFYWVDVDMMFTHCCGYALYVEKFGSFWIYTAGVYAIARDIETSIRKKLKTATTLKRLNIVGKANAVMENISNLMTRLIFLNYAIEEYKTDILTKYPKKYKVTHQSRYRSVISRLVKLFGVPLDDFPITVRYPVQEMYVRRLRRKGLLRNPVITGIKTYRGQYKRGEDKEV